MLVLDEPLTQVDEHDDVAQSPIVKNPGEPLPPAVIIDPASVPAEIQAKIRELMQPDPGRFLLQLVLAWAAIIGAICLAEYFDRLWLTVLAIAFIATRQNLLGLLMHEQCHRLAFRSKFGDRLCNWTIAYPLLVTLEGYRRVHIAHHQNYFTERDPDYVRKQGEEWTFPQQFSRLARSFARDLLGANVLKTIDGKGAKDANDGHSRRFALPWERIAFYFGLAMALTLCGLWKFYIIYWIIPIATVLQLIVRWGAICEHKYDLVDPSVPESTPIIEPRWWERLLLPNLNFTLHVYHHWYPRVPFAKLPAVHKLFRRAGLVQNEHVFSGYLSYLNFLVGGDRR